MFEKVKEFIKNHTEADVSNLELDTELVSLGLDSLSFLMLINDFEDEFNVKISNDDLSSIYTVKDLIDRLEK